MTWGVGTIIMLFYNGVILGAVAVDYIRAGQTKFLLGWLMPHGVDGDSGDPDRRPGRVDAGVWRSSAGEAGCRSGAGCAKFPATWSR